MCVGQATMGLSEWAVCVCVGQATMGLGECVCVCVGGQATMGLSEWAVCVCVCVWGRQPWDSVSVWVWVFF